MNNLNSERISRRSFLKGAIATALMASIPLVASKPVEWRRLYRYNKGWLAGEYTWMVELPSGCYHYTALIDDEGGPHWDSDNALMYEKLAGEWLSNV
jgi:hypothetical protein